MTASNGVDGSLRMAGSAQWDIALWGTVRSLIAQTFRVLFFCFLTAGIAVAQDGPATDVELSFDSFLRETLAAQDRDLPKLVRRYRRFLNDLPAGQHIMLTEDALTRPEVSSNEFARATLQGQLGTAYYYASRYDDAETALKKAFVDYELIDAQEGMALTLYRPGAIYFFKEEYGEAIRTYRQALKVNNGNVSEVTLFSIHANVSVLFAAVGLHEAGLEAAKFAAAYGKFVDPPRFAQANIVGFYIDLGRLDEAASEISKSLQDAAYMQHPKQASLVHRLAANLALEQGRYDDALFHNSASALDPTIITRHESIRNACREARALLGLDQLPSAIDAAKRCLTLAEQHGAIYHRAQAAEIGANVFEAAGRYEESAKYGVAALKLWQDNYKRIRAAQADVLSVELDLELQQSRVQIAEQARTLSELKVERQQRSIALFLIATVLFFSISLFLFFLFRDRAKKNAALLATTAELQASRDDVSRTAAQRETLLVELNHRVKNNLQVVVSLLGLEGRRSENDGADISTIRELQARILSMASIHEGLHGSVEANKVCLNSLLKRLAERLEGIYGSRCRISLDLVGEASVDLVTAAPLGLIICELVSNAYKHAYRHEAGTGAVVIGMQSYGSSVQISVADYGEGFSRTPAACWTASQGLAVARELAEQIDATLDLAENVPSGVIATLRLDAVAAKAELVASA